MGIQDRIFKFGKEDNFWGTWYEALVVLVQKFIMTVVKKYGCGKPDCTVGCEM